MRENEYDRPFADQANRLQYMPWMLPGYVAPNQPAPLWQRIREALRR